jgi:hypothetical protein
MVFFIVYFLVDMRAGNAYPSRTDVRARTRALRAEWRIAFTAVFAALKNREA